jgi:PKHD-type hydroxylase
MDLEHNYWYFEEALSKKFCEEIIAHGNSKREIIATVGNIPPQTHHSKLSKKDKKVLEKIRKSNVVFLNDLFIFKAIQPYIQTANINAGWNFDYDWAESAQFTKYKKNQFYDWHADAQWQPYQNKHENYNGKIRKISVTVELSDPKDYKGGELEFDYSNPKDGKIIKKCDQIKKQGSIVVFPSFVWHRVTPVTKGTRYSLVIWSIGKPWQ